jgi:hypothetical protein
MTRVLFYFSFFKLLVGPTRLTAALSLCFFVFSSFVLALVNSFVRNLRVQTTSRPYETRFLQGCRPHLYQWETGCCVPSAKVAGTLCFNWNIGRKRIKLDLMHLEALAIVKCVAGGQRLPLLVASTQRDIITQQGTHDLYLRWVFCFFTYRHLINWISYNL